jgi:hypothetical protein
MCYLSSRVNLNVQKVYQACFGLPLKNNKFSMKNKGYEGERILYLLGDVWFDFGHVCEEGEETGLSQLLDIPILGQQLK